MKCLRCNDNRVIWEQTVLGQMTCSPCPSCNKNGEAVKKEEASFKCEIERLKQEMARRERLAANG